MQNSWVDIQKPFIPILHNFPNFTKNNQLHQHCIEILQYWALSDNLKSSYIQGITNQYKLLALNSFFFPTKAPDHTEQKRKLRAGKDKLRDSHLQLLSATKPLNKAALNRRLSHDWVRAVELPRTIGKLNKRNPAVKSDRWWSQSQ